MQTKFAVATCVAGLAISGWAHQASAHHAFAAEFDANKPVNFKGTITKMEWINPHSWLHVAVKQDDGTVIIWAIEAGTGRDLTLPDGKQLFLGSSGTGAPYELPAGQQ
jgi:hypothetical protein